MAKRGHNKEGWPLDQVQIGLAVTKDESIPMFHKVFDGNIHDAKTIRHFFDDFETDCRSWIVWDRGITSKENIKDALNEKFHVLCGVPMKGRIKKIVDDTITSNQLCTDRKPHSPNKHHSLCKADKIRVRRYPRALNHLHQRERESSAKRTSIQENNRRNRRSKTTDKYMPT